MMYKGIENKPKIESFKDLEAWKEGHKLVILIYKLTKLFPKDEIFGIINQMRRAAVSITSNIAEGFSRQSMKEKSQFYSIAKGSLTEIQNQILISKDVGYMKDTEYNEAENQSIKVNKLITGLLKYTRNLSALVLPFILYTIPFILPQSFILHTNPFIPTAEAAAPTAGLVGYWNFDEGSGAVANDSSGNGNNGTINGASWVAGFEK